MPTSINATQPLYPSPDNAPSTSNNKATKPLPPEARKQFLEHMLKQFEPVQVPVNPAKTLETLLTDFRNSHQFTTTIHRTTDALKTILETASQSLPTKQTESLQKRFGEMLSKMKVPQQHNPWFHWLNKFDQHSPSHYSPEETLHAYQSACSELQMIAHLIQSATRGQLGIAPHEALKGINAFLQNLAADISVCGAGSLLNIEALRQNLQHQLLPGNLSEQFNNQVEMIVQEHIRTLLATLFHTDFTHEINEIHRIKAVRSIIGDILKLPKISIEKDPYAKSFAQELNARENAFLKERIISTLFSTLGPELTGDHIAISLANTYLDKIRSFLVSRNIDPLKIPYSSNAVENAIEHFSSEFRLPPVNYILNTPNRADYSRCITQSASLLGSWFLFKLQTDHPSAATSIEQIKTYFTQLPKIGNASNNIGTLGSAMHTPRKLEKVYQTGELIWTQHPDPLSCQAEALQLERLSAEWINRELEQTAITENPTTLSVFFEALVNTINNALLSDPDTNDYNENACAIFKRPVFESLGLSPLANVPPQFLNTEDKVQAMLILSLALHKHPKQSALSKILLPEEQIASQSHAPNGLQKLTNEYGIAQLINLQCLATPSNPLALDFFRNMLRNPNILPKMIKKEPNLLCWGIKQSDANVLNLIIQAYKLECPEQLAHTLKRNFPLHAKRNDKNIFPKWPISISDVQTSALCIAAIRGNTNLIDTLLQEHLDVNTVDQYGYSPLTYAAAFNSKAMVDSLIQHGANINGENTQKRKTNVPPILAAALTGDIANIEKLVQAGADVNQAAHSSNLTPLHIAYIERNFPMIEKLYDLGATHGETKATLFDSAPLTKKRTPFDMVLHHLKHSTTAKDSKLSRTQTNKEFARVYVLHHILNGMSFDTKPLIHGYPLIHALTYQNNPEALTMMIKHLSETQPTDKSTHLNARSSKGTHCKTPLMVAAKQGSLECLKYLLSHAETDLQAKDAKGRTALDIAREFKQHAAAELLRAHRPHPSHLTQTKPLTNIETNLHSRTIFRRHG